jgi:hypothetical protein
MVVPSRVNRIFANLSQSSGPAPTVIAEAVVPGLTSPVTASLRWLNKKTNSWMARS